MEGRQAAAASPAPSVPYQSADTGKIFYLQNRVSGNAPNITVNILEPYARVGERINELDLRIQKVIRFGKARANFVVKFMSNSWDLPPKLAFTH